MVRLGKRFYGRYGRKMDIIKDQFYYTEKIKNFKNFVQTLDTDEVLCYNEATIGGSYENKE